MKKKIEKQNVSDYDFVHRELLRDLHALQITNPDRNNQYLSGAQDKVLSILVNYFDYKQRKTRLK